MEKRLNSTMFRWNLGLAGELRILGKVFKFHYVQMKPTISQYFYLLFECLDSTMFRWNNDNRWSEVEMLVRSLNSTMFRWNKYGSSKNFDNIVAFKFHYVQMKHKKIMSFLTREFKFKFHYVQMKLL